MRALGDDGRPGFVVEMMHNGSIAAHKHGEWRCWSARLLDFSSLDVYQGRRNGVTGVYVSRGVWERHSLHEVLLLL